MEVIKYDLGNTLNIIYFLLLFGIKGRMKKKDMRENISHETIKREKNEKKYKPTK